MSLKLSIILILVLGIFACTKQNQNTETADMYHPSELSQMMRDMVLWSKETKNLLSKGEVIDDVPKNIEDLYVSPRYFLHNVYGSHSFSHPQSAKTINKLFE